MLYLVSDHGGFELKERLLKYFAAKGIVCHDLGAFSLDENDDYPDYAAILKRAMAQPEDLGIAVCASGQGICIALNRYSSIRAAQGWSIDSAMRARHDDNCNVLCLGGKVKNIDAEESIAQAFLDTKFDAQEKRLRRLEKIELINSKA